MGDSRYNIHSQLEHCKLSFAVRICPHFVQVYFCLVLFVSWYFECFLCSAIKICRNWTCGYKQVVSINWALFVFVFSFCCLQFELDCFFNFVWMIRFLFELRFSRCRMTSIVFCDSEWLVNQHRDSFASYIGISASDMQRSKERLIYYRPGSSFTAKFCIHACCLWIWVYLYKSMMFFDGCAEELGYFYRNIFTCVGTNTPGCLMCVFQ